MFQKKKKTLDHNALTETCSNPKKKAPNYDNPPCTDKTQASTHYFFFTPPSVYNISLFSHILSSLCVVYPRGRSFSIKTLKRFYLAFLLSVEALLEADPNEF